jgi:hypothetical protein
VERGRGDPVREGGLAEPLLDAKEIGDDTGD